MAKIITFLGGIGVGPNGRPLNQFKSPNGDILTLEPLRPVGIEPTATPDPALQIFYADVVSTAEADAEHFRVEDDTAGLVGEGQALVAANLTPGIGEVVMPEPPPEPPGTVTAAQGMRVEPVEPTTRRRERE